MNKIFTEEDVLLYIYNELNKEEISDFESELKNNPKLAEFYFQTLSTINILNKEIENPSQQVLGFLNEKSNESSLESPTY